MANDQSAPKSRDWIDDVTSTMNDAFAAVSYALDASWLWDAGLSTVEPIESRPCNNAPKRVHTARTLSGTDSSSDSEKEDYTSSNEDRHGNIIDRDYVHHATDVQLGADMYVRRKELSPASRQPSLCLEARKRSLLEEWELRSHSQFFNSVLRPEEAPSTSGQDQWASHQERIRAYDLEEVLIVGDGNCQFRALAHQMFQSQERHLEVRRAVHAQLRRHPKRYKNHVPGVYKDYVEQMRQPGAWGDHVTLQAMADTYRVRIQMATPVVDQGMMEIAPYKQETRRLPVVWLSFWPEIHYNSLQPAGLKADAFRPVYLELPFPHQSNVIHDLFPGATVGKSSDTSPVRYKDMYEYDSDDGGGMSQPPPRKTASLPWTRFTRRKHQPSTTSPKHWTSSYGNTSAYRKTETSKAERESGKQNSDNAIAASDEETDAIWHGRKSSGKKAQYIRRIYHRVMGD